MAAKRSNRPSPVSLLFASLLLIGCLIAANRPVPLICLVILFLVAMLGLRVRLGQVVRSILKLWPLLILTFGLHAVLSSHEAGISGTLPIIGFNSAGLRTAAFFSLRLIAILGVGFALYQVYPPQKYGRAVGQLLGKLPFWRTSLAQLDLTISLAMQFVPFVEQEYRRLNMALEARGISGQNAFSQRLLAQRRILFPLMVNAFRRADQASLALQARGYDPRIIRTSLYPVKAGAGEILLILAFSAACVAVLWL